MAGGQCLVMLKIDLSLLWLHCQVLTGVDSWWSVLMLKVDLHPLVLHFQALTKRPRCWWLLISIDAEGWFESLVSMFPGFERYWWYEWLLMLKADLSSLCLCFQVLTEWSRYWWYWSLLMLKADLSPLYLFPGFDREAQVLMAAGQCLLTMFKSGAPFSTSTTRQSVANTQKIYLIRIVIGLIAHLSWL